MTNDEKSQMMRTSGRSRTIGELMVGSVGEPSRAQRGQRELLLSLIPHSVLELEYFVNVLMCVVGHICHSHQRVQISNGHCTIGVQDRENEHKFYNVRLVEFTCVIEEVHDLWHSFTTTAGQYKNVDEQSDNDVTAV